MSQQHTSVNAAPGASCVRLCVPVGGQWCDLSQGGGGRCGGLQVPRCLCCRAAARGLRCLWALEGAAWMSWETQVGVLVLYHKNTLTLLVFHKSSDTIWRVRAGFTAAMCRNREVTLGLRPKHSQRCPTRDGSLQEASGGRGKDASTHRPALNVKAVWRFFLFLCAIDFKWRAKLEATDVSDVKLNSQCDGIMTCSS